MIRTSFVISCDSIYKGMYPRVNGKRPCPSSLRVSSLDGLDIRISARGWRIEDDKHFCPLHKEN